ncbi:hypothetical protein [Steroidobacter sp.]|uniref:hypothetical protein n=1 Tax=Steroidobacter sp. TaxID=1978227 RepID=UPI001A5AF983|nr:hypothetical protein [Steroidobacter sp.]MBL8270972.1 hypothetical protein [Steroidobacter sp.]
MSTPLRNSRLTARSQAWLALVLVAMFANVIAFVTHDHSAPAPQSHIVACDWCVAHAGFASPPQVTNPCDFVQRATDEVVQTRTVAIYSSPLLTAQPRGPPFA